MLNIAGGIIIAFFAILAIFSLIRLIVNNSQEIFIGCGLILLAFLLYGAWYFLDSEFPEVDWIKTAFALIGIIILILFAFGIILSAYDYYKSPKMTSEEKKINQKLYKDILNRNQTKCEKIVSIIIYSVMSLIFIAAIYTSFVM